MKQTITEIKHKETLLSFGKTLFEQRTFISKETEENLANILNKTISQNLFNSKIISRMEQGDEEIPILYWVYVWIHYQNIDKIKLAYDPKEMIYLAQQAHFPNIEEEILTQTNKKL